MTPSELIKKWEKIGFLETCKNKHQMSRIFEDMFKILTNNDIRLENRNFVESAIFPLLYRLYNQRNLNFDTIELRILLKRFDKSSLTIKDLHVSHYLTLDTEAEFVSLYSETYKK